MTESFHPFSLGSGFIGFGNPKVCIAELHRVILRSPASLRELLRPRVSSILGIGCGVLGQGLASGRLWV